MDLQNISKEIKIALRENTFGIKDEEGVMHYAVNIRTACFLVEEIIRKYDKTENNIM